MLETSFGSCDPEVVIRLTSLHSSARFAYTRLSAPVVVLCWIERRVMAVSCLRIAFPEDYRAEAIGGEALRGYGSS